MITTDVISNATSLTPEWEALAARTGSPPFYYPGWVAAWWSAFGTGALEIFTLRVDGHLRGVLPLYRPAWRAAAYKTEPLPPSARPGTLRSTANWHVPEFGLLSQAPLDARRLLDSVFARRPNLISLACLYRESAISTHLLSAASKADYKLDVCPLRSSPFVTIDGSWADYQASLSAKMLSDLRRRRRRLSEEGRVWLDTRSGPDRVPESLAEGFRLESSGWKARQDSAITSRPVTHKFYTELAAWAAAQGLLRLTFLRIDQRAVAFQYALEANGTYYFLKGGYDPAFQRFAPGKLLVYEMLRRAFGVGLHRFDFLGGDESWKKEWTATCRHRVVMHASAPSVLGRVERAAILWARPLGARAKATLRPLRPLRATIRSQR